MVDRPEQLVDVRRRVGLNIGSSCCICCVFVVGSADSGTSLNDVGGFTRGPLLLLLLWPLGKLRAAAATERRDVRLARRISSCSAAVFKEGDSGF